MSSPRTRSARRLRATTIFASLALLAGLGAAPPVAAAPITRYVGPGGGPGACSAPAYATIQPAVTAASAGDTIHVCAGTYTLAATVTVGVDLSFVGDGAATTILDGTSAYRILDATDRSITLSGLTLRNGFENYEGGAALRVYSAMVTDSTFSDNNGFATASGGGAIRADAELIIENSTFSGNSAGDGSGGAIYALYASVTNSTFSENTAYAGGAIDVYGGAVTNSTFSGNTAYRGGAIDANGASYGFSVTNSTFSGNTATWAGAIWSDYATVTNSTFSANTAEWAAAIGAFYEVTVTNSILAQPSELNNCYITFTDGGGNFGTDTSCGFTLPASHNSVAIASLALGSLASNGGPTATIALGAGSVAIDAGLDAVCAAYPVSGLDQRGVTRPQGAHCDSGAYEAPAHPVSYPAVIRAGVWYLRDSNTSTPGTITAFAYGAPSDVPVFGDWDGDGTKTPGVVRVTGGSLTWYLRNSNSSGAPDLVFTWGAATDRPLVGDWNGDGVDSIGLLRGNWWLLRNSNSIGAPDIDFFWGLAADTPLVGDWNGDGIDSPGWLRCLGVSCTPGTGNWWLLRNSNSGGATDLDFFWGRTTENAWVTGDWDGDGTDNPGILRGEWWLLRAANSDGAPTSDFFYGLPSDTFRVWAK